MWEGECGRRVSVGESECGRESVLVWGESECGRERVE